MSEDGTFSEEQWVRIMPDYSADGVWHRDGCAGDADELPVGKDLVARIRVWQSWYESSISRDYDAAPDWDSVAFAKEGLAIAQAVKAALPHFTVIYFDEHKARSADPSTPFSAFEYEIDLPAT